MKSWKEPEITELGLNRTELGKEVTPYIDGTWTDENNDNWYSFSGPRGV